MAAGWTGLFALALQILLSFAHVHADRSHAHQPNTTNESCTPSAPTGCVEPVSLLDREISGQADHDEGDHDDERDCAICWTLASVRHAVLAACLALILVRHRETVPPPRPAPPPLARALSFPFGARAPPRAA